MDKLIKILNTIRDDVDYNTEEKIIDNHIFDSLAIIMLIAELEDEFDLTIPTIEIVPENFNSAKSIMKLIEKIREEE